MKPFTKRTITLLLALSLVLSMFSFTAGAAGEIITDPTGYTKAEDVVYLKDGKYIANWGARGEDCVFLSSYATAYYTGNYTYGTLSGMNGGTSQSSAPRSDLYSGLKSMMVAEHTLINSYGDARYWFCYTDCLKNETTHFSSFYSGKSMSSVWDSGKTWNREHTWPNSKGLGGSDEDDIMMLRPTAISENTNRGNSAYGESSGYYDPGVSVRGDCARIALYVYVRWGNTGNMWGSGGEIENLDILLKWMEEDPVDTWEMGRNDAVQAITGVRNVFVDYPEYAWLLFGEEIPEGMVTPSGIAKNGYSGSDTPDVPDVPVQCSHNATEIRGAKTATCTAAGYTGDTYCKECKEKLSSGTTIAAIGHKNENGDNLCDICSTSVSTVCDHGNTELRGVKEAACTAAGYTGDTYCKDCGEKLSTGTEVPAVGHKNENGDELCDTCSASVACGHGETEIREAKEATCTELGYTGDTHCKHCDEKLASGTAIPIIDHKDENGDNACDICTAVMVVCNHTSTEIRNIKHATCAQEGYTGDEYCKNCGEIVESGQVTSVSSKHSYGQWEIVKEATTKEEGSRERTCVTCGQKQTEVIPMVEKPVNWVIPAACVVGCVGVGGGVYVIAKKGRKKTESM